MNKAIYKNGCVVIDVPDDEIKICPDRLEYKKGDAYEVKGLYDSLVKFFSENLPNRIYEIGKLKGEDFEISRWDPSGKNNILIKKTGAECHILYSNFMVEFKNGELSVMTSRILLYENCGVNLDRFINEIFGGMIYYNADAINIGDDLVLDCWGGEFLRISKNGMKLNKNFLLLVGELRGLDEVLRWIKKVAKEMEYVGKMGYEKLYTTLVFRYGVWDIEFIKSGELENFKLITREAEFGVNDSGVWVYDRRTEPGAIILNGKFEKEGIVSEIFRKNNKILRSLIF